MTIGCRGRAIWVPDGIFHRSGTTDPSTGLSPLGPLGRGTFLKLFPSSGGPHSAVKLFARLNESFRAGHLSVSGVPSRDWSPAEIRTRWRDLCTIPAKNVPEKKLDSEI